MIGKADMKKFEKPSYLYALKQLVQCYQSYEKLANQHFIQLGLTSSQFDIIATLGNTQGMSCKELGEKTLITKGTMTGVLDRLEKKEILTRCPVQGDRRLYLIKLTDKGQSLFEEIFPLHLEHMNQYFSHVGQETVEQLGLVCSQVNSSLAAFIEPDKDCSKK